MSSKEFGKGFQSVKETPSVVSVSTIMGGGALGCTSSPPYSNSSGKSYRQGLKGPASSLQYLSLFLSSSPHRVFSSVLFLLLFAFVATTAAQTTPTANDDGSYSVPYDWALKPSGVSGGERFRLLFVTSTQRDATATSIATYNSFVQTRAAAGHSAIQPYSAQFKVVGSTATVDARDNTSTTGRGVPIYWLNGAKIADNYPDFYDGSWDDGSGRNETGTMLLNATTVWTGSNSDGTKHSNPLGHAAFVIGGNTGLNPLDQAGEVSTVSDNFYGLSPVFVVTPPPDVSVHPYDTIGYEGGSGIHGTATVELRLRRALTSGETLTVTYSIDLNVNAVESHNGVMLSHTAGSNTSTGTVTITGPNAPKNIRLSLSPANNTIWHVGMRASEFKLTGVSGVAGAALSGVTSAKVFVNDRNFTRTTYMSAWSREVEEGGKLIVMLHGKAGRKISLGPGSHRYHGYNATVGVQNLTADFNDLGEGYAGHDAFGGYLRREGDTDYYNVAALGSGRSAELVIPITSDGTREGDERFRVFIVDTDRTYMGVRGTYNSLYSAPGIDFTIKGQSGGPQRAPSQQPEPPPVPTQAVSNIQVTALDADSAEVTWDAVEHATSYELEWEGVSIAGINADITGTTSTIDHYAPEPMTLTITVIPQYIDENGDTQQLNDLSGTAVFDVGGGSKSSDDQDSIQAQDDNNQQQEEDCDLDEVQSDVENYVLETYNGDAHVARWQRVLNAFAGNDGGMSGVEARFMVTLFSANRWEPAAKAIECLEEARGKDNTYAELIAKMYEWRYDTRYVSYKSHTNRWDRALLAFGESVSDSSLEPMTAADAQVFADRGWSRWVEVAKALWEIE